MENVFFLFAMIEKKMLLVLTFHIAIESNWLWIDSIHIIIIAYTC